ncbi:hypothetical protein [Nocardia otitidiscaviarum]|uniref:hypothetical protein n=1 Tax=Nocardia otitidiscaviarum TaxID=1823 RepID=UPI000A5FC34A|nr:hypothetical protein [Nocardia otitidiscaviarum]
MPEVRITIDGDRAEHTITAHGHEVKSALLRAISESNDLYGLGLFISEDEL